MMGNWPCFSTSGVNDLASGVAGSWIFIPMKLFTALFRPSHHWASLKCSLTIVDGKCRDWCREPSAHPDCLNFSDTVCFPREPMVCVLSTFIAAPR